MEEAKIKYCFIGKMRTSTMLLEYNRLKRNGTLLEAKQMFMRCCEYSSLNLNERFVVKSKYGCFYLLTYSPDLFIQLFGEELLKEDEAYYVIDRIKEMIESDGIGVNDSDDSGNVGLQFENKKTIYAFLENYCGFSENNDKANKENDIVIDIDLDENNYNRNKMMKDMNMSGGFNNAKVMGTGIRYEMNKTTTPTVYDNINRKVNMSLQYNNINNQGISYTNQRYANANLTDLKPKPLQLQHSNFQSQPNQIFQLQQQQPKTEIELNQTPFQPSKSFDSYNVNNIINNQGNNNPNVNKSNLITTNTCNINQAPVLFRNQSDTKSITSKTKVTNAIVLQDSRAKSANGTPTGYPLTYNPYLHQLQSHPNQIILEEEKNALSKWIIFSFLIIIILVAVIAIPLIMAFSNPF